jgi:serine/threonine protein kinase
MGCILFHFVVGRPPFKGTNEYQTFQKIIKLQFIIPESIDESITSLIKSILITDPGVRPTLPIFKQNCLFDSIDWKELKKRTVTFPAYLEPLVKDPLDLINDDFSHLKFEDDSDSDGNW